MTYRTKKTNTKRFIIAAMWHHFKSVTRYNCESIYFNTAIGRVRFSNHNWRGALHNGTYSGIDIRMDWGRDYTFEEIDQMVRGIKFKR